MPPKPVRFTASADKRTFEQYIATLQAHKDAAWVELQGMQLFQTYVCAHNLIPSAMFDPGPFRVIEPPSAAFRQLCQEFFDGKEVVADYDTIETTSQDSDLIDLDDTSATMPSEPSSYEITWYHDRTDMWKGPISDPKLVVFLIDSLLSREIKKAISENVKYKMMRVFHSHDHASHMTKLNKLDKTKTNGDAGLWQVAGLSFQLSAKERSRNRRSLRYVDGKSAKNLKIADDTETTGNEGNRSQIPTINIDDIVAYEEEDGSTAMGEVSKPPEPPTKSKKKKKKAKKHEIKMAQTTEGDAVGIPESDQMSTGAMVETTVSATTSLNREGSQKSKIEVELEIRRLESEHCSTHTKSSKDRTLELSEAGQAMTDVAIEESVATFAKGRKGKKPDAGGQALDTHNEREVVLQKSSNTAITKSSAAKSQASRIHRHPLPSSPTATMNEQDAFISVNAKPSNDDTPKSTGGLPSAIVSSASSENTPPALADDSVSEQSSTSKPNLVKEETSPVQTSPKRKTRAWRRQRGRAKARDRARAQPETSQAVNVLESTSHEGVSDEVTPNTAAKVMDPILSVKNDSSDLESDRNITSLDDHTICAPKEMSAPSNAQQSATRPVSKVTEQTVTLPESSGLLINTISANDKGMTECTESYITVTPAVHQPHVAAESPHSTTDQLVSSGTHEPQELEEYVVVESNLDWADLTIPTRSLPHNRFPSLQDLRSRFKENGDITLEAEEPAQMTAIQDLQVLTEAEVPVQMTAVRDPQVLTLQFGDAPIGAGLSLPLTITREPRFHFPDASPSNETAIVDTITYDSPLEQISTGPGLNSADDTPKYFVPSPSFVTTVPGTNPKDLATFSSNINGGYQLRTPPGLQRNPIFQTRASRSFSVPPPSNVMISSPKQAVSDHSGHGTEDENGTGNTHAHPSISEDQLSEQNSQHQANPSAYVCSCCKLERYATPNEPIYICPFCGLLNNVRYCSRVCILADSFEHASKCAKYPASNSAIIIDPPSHYVYDKDALMSLHGWGNPDSAALVRQKIFSMYCSTGKFPEVCKAWSMKEETRAGTYSPNFRETPHRVTGDYHIFCSSDPAAGAFAPTEVIAVSSCTSPQSHR